MRAICGLFALLIMLGPIGMGMMLNVDSPYLEDDALYTNFEGPLPEDYGTRAIPSETPQVVDLYYRNGNIMNTTIPGNVDTNIGGLTISFALQDPLINDLTVEEPSSGFPFTVIAYLTGAGTLDITIRDGSGGTIVGEGSYGPFSLGNLPQKQTIGIDLSFGTNYTFVTGNQIVVEFDFGTSTGRLHYHSDQAPSRLELYCTSIPDITVDTYNFYNEPVTTFYPNDIDDPDLRRQVRIRGVITEVFGKHGRIQYINDVDVVIEGPDTNITRACSYDKTNFEYSYTWNYISGQPDGIYTLTAHVFDEQNNEFTVSKNFTMSTFGVLLTSPSQFPEEGTYKAEAQKNLVEGSITTYVIKVWNIGNNASSFDITTSGQSGWDWWISAENNNLTDNYNKTGRTDSISAGDFLGIKLTVDAMSNPIGSPPATVLITASSIEDNTESSSLTTKSTVVQQFDVDMEFLENSQKNLVKKIETGNSIDIGFTVENKGGEDDTIYIDLSSVPSGWTLSLDGDKLEGSQVQYWVFLESGHPTDLILTIDTPSDIGEEEVAIDIVGRSKGSTDQGDNPIASDKISVNVKTTTGLSLTLDDFIEKDVDPDQDIAFKFEIENTGTKLANFTVTFSGLPSSDGWESGDASFDPSGFETQKEFFNLAPNNPQDFWLYVEPTLDVMAGNYTILIHAENNQAPTSKFADQLIFCWVNEFYNMEIVEPISLEDSADAEPGDDVEYTIIIENNGNVAERVSVSVDKPGDWKLDFGNVSEDWIMDIEPGETETIPIVLTVPKDAKGDETVEITITIVPSNSDIIQVVTFTTIKQNWFQPFLTLLVPLLLFIVILVMVVVIYKRR